VERLALLLEHGDENKDPRKNKNLNYSSTHLSQTAPEKEVLLQRTATFIGS